MRRAVTFLQQAGEEVPAVRGILTSMIEPPRIVTLSARPIAVIPLLIPREQMPQVFGPAVGELVSTVQAQKLRADGAGLRAPPSDGPGPVGLRARGPGLGAGDRRPAG